MQRQFFSGNSLDQAVMAAARQFQLEPEQLAYKIRDKKHGFLSARRKVVIEVDPQAPQLTERAAPAPPPPAPAPVVATRPAEVENDFEDDDAPAVGNRQDDERTTRAEAERPSRERAGNHGPPNGNSTGGNHQTGAHSGNHQGGGNRHGNAQPDRGQRRPDDRFGRDQHRRVGGGESSARDGRGGGQRPDGNRRPAHPGNRQDGSNGGGAKSGFRGRGGEGRRFGGPDRQRDSEKSRRTIIRRVEHRWQDRNWLQGDDEGEGVSKEILAFERGIEMILDIVDIDIEFAVTEGDPFKVDFSGEDHQILIAEDGQILKSIEHILPRLVRSAVGESLTCRVDCENFQASHEESLMEMARSVASEVKQNKKAKALPPMNPADRRLVHVALMEDPDVDTQSEGEGYIKRVKILPVRR